MTLALQHPSNNPLPWGLEWTEIRNNTVVLREHLWCHAIWVYSFSIKTLADNLASLANHFVPGKIIKKYIKAWRSCFLQKRRFKKKLTCWGIEPRLYEMHEFLQVDFCKFLPVAFATKNPRQIFDATSMVQSPSSIPLFLRDWELNVWVFASRFLWLFATRIDMVLLIPKRHLAI